MIAALKNHFFLSLLLFAGLAVSCKHHTFYHKTTTLHKEMWNMDSALVYEFTIVDSLQFYSFYIDVRNTTDYPRQNLYLFFTTYLPDGAMFTDTLNCILSDAYGRWTGKGSGRIKENRFLFKPKVRFQQKGDYVFSVKQAMREENLKGITDFGITLQYE
jgi:gliding motility-associated lipoprotein GldH